MLRIITFNLNGIRSAAKKGFFAWFAKQNADVVCVQETKAQLEKLDGEVFRPKGYYSYFADAEKPGYSGVGLYSRHQPDKVTHSFGWKHADVEGRYLQADYGKTSIVSLYMPSGSSGPLRQAVKYEFMEHYFKFLQQIRQQQRDYIICGDWNIAHKQIDLKNWRSNQKTSGFLPEERAWMDKVIEKSDWVDAFRVVNQQPDQYTFWSTRGRAYEKNVGWRIDYEIITPALKNKVKAANIYKEQRFSDHAPLIIDYDLILVNK